MLLHGDLVLKIRLINFSEETSIQKLTYLSIMLSSLDAVSSFLLFSARRMYSLACTIIHAWKSRSLVPCSVTPTHRIRLRWDQSPIKQCVERAKAVKVRTKAIGWGIESASTGQRGEVEERYVHEVQRRRKWRLLVVFFKELKILITPELITLAYVENREIKIFQWYGDKISYFNL